MTQSAVEGVAELARATQDAQLVEMWRNNLRKSQRAPETPAVRPASGMFQWTGGGAALVLTAMDSPQIDIPFPCRIVRARLYAFNVNRLTGSSVLVPVAVTATVDIQLTQFGVFGSSVPLHGSGSQPALSSETSADIDLAGWQVDLLTTDTLIATPVEFTGLAQNLVLSLLLRPTGRQVGITEIVDGAADQIVDADGNPVVLRG